MHKDLLFPVHLHVYALHCCSGLPTSPSARLHVRVRVELLVFLLATYKDTVVVNGEAVYVLCFFYVAMRYAYDICDTHTSTNVLWYTCIYEEQISINA